MGEQRKYVYAVDNGMDYSDHDIYLFECDVELAVVEQICAAVHSLSNRAWKVLAGGELLRSVRAPWEHAFGAWIERALEMCRDAIEWSDDDKAPNPIDAIVDASPAIGEALERMMNDREAGRAKGKRDG